MPIAPTYPGVYIEEIPSGVHAITGVATSITAFVGFTVQGPVDEAVRIFNFGDFQRQFGGLNADSEISYAVQQFFLNGGTDAYVVRVAQGAAPAQVTLNDGSGNPALVVTAATPGAWGNNVRLDVDYATTNPDSSFNLTVARYDLQGAKFVATVTEKYLNLSLNSRSANYALGVVNAASQLVKLALPAAGLSLADATDRGWSLSGNLAAFPMLTAQTTQISGVLEGTTPFSLVLTGALRANPAAIVTSVNNAIAAAGLSARLIATVADAFGVDSGAGTYLKLKSQFVVANPNTKAEFSSVQIIPAATNDAARKLTLGLSGGGREKDGVSVRRPAQTGTASASLADLLGTTAGGALDITINDNSSGAPVQITTGTVTIPGTTVVGTAWRDALQAAIRSLTDASAQQAVVQLNGTVLRAVPSANTPNASIVFGNTAAMALRLTGAGSFNNVQQFSLGGGASFGAQTGATAGADGTPPNTTQILGDYNAKTGLYALRDVDLFNLLVIPRTVQLGSAEANAVYAAALAFCQERRAFFLLDPDPTKTVANIGDWLTITGATGSSNGAVFFPPIQIPDPLNGFRLINVPPSPRCHRSRWTSGCPCPNRRC
jgi:hypothetical protein